MQMAGYEPTDNEEDADAVFLNTCSVRENAENKIYHRLDQLFAKKNHNARLKGHGSDSRMSLYTVSSFPLYASKWSVRVQRYAFSIIYASFQLSLI